jgi:hypothetical protein
MQSARALAASDDAEVAEISACAGAAFGSAEDAAGALSMPAGGCAASYVRTSTARKRVQAVRSRKKPHPPGFSIGEKSEAMAGAS